ncbi:hypothetical protein GCM10009682_31720 [Luedemannella flava]|uniref:Transcriptional regulator n=2 Tax=Luedemannella flava TaxID=349316 RepID=A0ABP4YCE9_9ACTN
MHVTTMRFHLDQLEHAGLVLSHFTTAFGVGRPRKVYVLAPEADRPDRSATHLKLLAGLLSEAFDSNVTPEQTGARWIQEHVELERTGPAATPGAWLTKIGRLMDILRRWGYSADVSTTGGGRSCRIDLVDCPFLDLARVYPEVVCGIHRGLLVGALAQMGEDDVEISLKPFVGPNLCHAHVHANQLFDIAPRGPDEP